MTANISLISFDIKKTLVKISSTSNWLISLANFQDMLTATISACASITSKLTDISYTSKSLLTSAKILDLAINLSANISHLSFQQGKANKRYD